MKKRILVRVGALAVGLLVFSAVSAHAQSLDLTNRDNGLRLAGSTMWDDKGYRSSGVGFAYGIGGRLDIGFDIGLLDDEIQDEHSQETRLSLLLRGVFARQSEGFPVSLTLGLNYHFSLVESEYLDERFDDYDLLREGRGYAVSGGVWRDFSLGSSVDLRSGLGARFDVERYTTSVSSSLEESATGAITRYPVEDVDRAFSYTAAIGPVIRPPAGTYVLNLLATAHVSQAGEFSGGGAQLGVTFVRRN